MAKQVLHYEREESLARQRQKERVEAIEPGTRYADPKVNNLPMTPVQDTEKLNANWDKLFKNKLTGMNTATGKALRTIAPQLVSQLQAGGEGDNTFTGGAGTPPVPSLDALAKPPTHTQRWQNPSMAMPAAPFIPQPRSRQFIVQDALRRDAQGVSTGGIAEVERRSAMPGYFAPAARPVASGFQTTSPLAMGAIDIKYGASLTANWDKLKNKFSRTIL